MKERAMACDWGSGLPKDIRGIICGKVNCGCGGTPSGDQKRNTADKSDITPQPITGTPDVRSAGNPCSAIPRSA